MLEKQNIPDRATIVRCHVWFMKWDSWLFQLQPEEITVHFTVAVIRAICSNRLLALVKWGLENILQI